MTNTKLLENTRRYRRTPKGVLTNMYQHMKARQRVDFSLGEFHEKFLNDKKYIRLFNAWEKSGYSKQLKPSVDRSDCRKPYTFTNIKMMTWAENRYKQSQTDGKRGRKPPVLMVLGGKVMRRFISQRHAVRELGLSQGNLSAVLNGKRQTVSGYYFIYENPDLLEVKNEGEDRKHNFKNIEPI